MWSPGKQACFKIGFKGAARLILCVFRSLWPNVGHVAAVNTEERWNCSVCQWSELKTCKKTEMLWRRRNQNPAEIHGARFSPSPPPLPFFCLQVVPSEHNKFKKRLLSLIWLILLASHLLAVLFVPPPLTGRCSAECGGLTHILKRILKKKKKNESEQCSAELHLSWLHLSDASS